MQLLILEAKCTRACMHPRPQSSRQAGMLNVLLNSKLYCDQSQPEVTALSFGIFTHSYTSMEAPCHMSNGQPVQPDTNVHFPIQKGFVSDSTLSFQVNYNHCTFCGLCD